MPYRSNSQRKFFHASEDEGGMPKQTVNEFDKASKGLKLPTKAPKPMTHNPWVDLGAKKGKSGF